MRINTPILSSKPASVKSEKEAPQPSGASGVSYRTTLVRETPKVNKQAIIDRWVSEKESWKEVIVSALIKGSASYSGLLEAVTVINENIDNKIQPDLTAVSDVLQKCIAAAFVQAGVDRFGLTKDYSDALLQMTLLNKASRRPPQEPPELAKLRAQISAMANMPPQNPFGVSMNSKERKK